MYILDLFFNNSFDGVKCKTLLKLTISHIKLLRNNSENHLKQMRKEIAKLLLTGKEAAAYIWVCDNFSKFDMCSLFGREVYVLSTLYGSKT